MQTYRTPTVENVELDSHLLRAQATPQITCEPNNCGTGFGGAECDELDGASDEVEAQFFLPGTTSADTPSCVAIVNGITSGPCTILGTDGECEEGANWFVECSTNVDCTGSDTIVISCDGFQDSEPCVGFPE